MKYFGYCNIFWIKASETKNENTNVNTSKIIFSCSCLKYLDQNNCYYMVKDRLHEIFSRRAFKRVYLFGFYTFLSAYEYIIDWFLRFSLQTPKKPHSDVRIKDLFT